MIDIDYLVLDIETGYAHDIYIEQAINNWSPPKNIKDEEKIAARRNDFLNEVRLKSAVSDHAPIVSLAIKGMIDDEPVRVVFGAIGKVDDYPVCESLRDNGWQVYETNNEVELLSQLSVMLDDIIAMRERILLVGHNVKKFDLPKLRTRTLYNKLQLPLLLQPHKFPVFDTMSKAPYFLAGCGEYVAFEKLEIALGIVDHSHKQIFSGAEVPEMAHLAAAALDCEEFEEWQSLVSLIMTYNAKDVVQEEKAFKLMNGLA